MPEHDPASKPAVSRSIAGFSGESLRTAGRFLRYLWPYRGKFAAAQVCLLLSSLAGLGFPYFTGRFIDSALRGAGSAVADAAGPASGLDMNAIAPLLFLLLAVQTSCSFLQSYWLSEVGERSLADLRRDTYCAFDPDADRLFQRAQGRRADQPARSRSHGDSAHADRHDARSAPPGGDFGWRLVFDRVDFGQVDLGDAAFGARRGGFGRCSGPQDP